MDFGMTVMPDPPYQRFIDLVKHAEELGFDYGWTYDSHVLWQESIPTLALAAKATSGWSWASAAVTRRGATSGWTRCR
jgi:alkanesulfonate monooxygenase SsuD/methylene tetrahydromethanopterin reductase-like flavin-dependent oxidoreductase (luciferase family)